MPFEFHLTPERNLHRYQTSYSTFDRGFPCPLSKARVCKGAGTGLVILDDWFPNLMTGFRVAEFVHHLRVFPGLQVLSTHIPSSAHYAEFAKRYPDVANRVLPWEAKHLETAGAVWLVFLNNAYFWLDEIERRSIPFVFTLYPGGGFNLNDQDGEAKLRRVLSSPMLHAIIATHPVTLETLERMNCPVPVHNIPGLVVNPAYILGSRARTVKPAVGAAKICFAAFRYDLGGRSKGYPEFLEAGAMLARAYERLEFAVVGDLGPADWPIPKDLQGRITFHDPMPTSELRRFFLRQDLIISPSRRYAISGREFDGFPTGSCVEGALCGAAILSSDELDQNRFYVPDEEILICLADAEAIASTVEPLVRDPARLAAIAEAGRQRTIALYGAAAQLVPRTRIIRALAAEAGILV